MKRNIPSSDSESAVEKQPRRQDPVSCHFCRKKKLKCDRGSPCSNCRSRKLTCSSFLSGTIRSDINRCTEPSTGLTSKESTSSSQLIAQLNDRVKRLENLVVANSRIDQTVSDVQILHSQPGQTQPQEEIKPQSPTEIELTKTVTWLENDAIAHYQPDLKYFTAGDDVAEGFRTFNYSIARPPSEVYFSQDMYASWPPREYGERLLDHYIRELGWMYHIIHVPTVRKHFDILYSTMEKHQTPNYAHLALIATLFTLSAYFCLPESDIRPQKWSDVHCWASIARDALAAADCLATPTLETLQSICLISQHIMPNVGSISGIRILGAIMVHSARTLSIHKVDSPLNKKFRENANVDWAEVEVKRRVWWHIVSTDWFISFISGVPCGTYMVHPGQMQVDMPTNTDDDLINHNEPCAQPEDIHTETTFQRFRIEVSVVYREIVDCAWDSGCDIDNLPYGIVLECDQKMNNLIRELDKKINLIRIQTLKSDDNDPIGKAKKLKALARQRCTNNFSIHTRLSRLHRPYLLRGVHDPQYTYSRMVCLRSARGVIELGKELISASDNLKSVKIVAFNHHVFVSTMILVIDYCFTRDEPRGLERKQEILDCFKVLELGKGDNTMASRGIQTLQELLRRRPESQDGQDGAETERVMSAAELSVYAPQKPQEVTTSSIQDSSFSCVGEQGPLNPPNQQFEDMDFAMFEDINWDAEIDPKQFEAMFEKIEGRNDMF